MLPALYYENSDGSIYHGDALTVLKTLPDESVNCCVTSPPYWGLRDYGTAEWDGGDAGCDHIIQATGATKNKGCNGGMATARGDCQRCGATRIDKQLGLERTPEEYVAKMVEVFSEVKRVLRDDGTLWLNLGDSYANNGVKNPEQVGGFTGEPIRMGGKGHGSGYMDSRPRKIPDGLKPKDLCGIPWLVAFALRADGWYLRQDIIWHKPNPMPESVTDRCTKAHEYIFLMSKSQRYFYDAAAIQEPFTDERMGNPGGGGNYSKQVSSTGFRNDGEYALGKGIWNEDRSKNGRNKRSVWSVTTQPYSAAHFATFPPKLIEPCIMAGCPVAGTVLDPFMGAGTTAVVAYRHDRKFVGIELSQKYLDKITIPRIEAERKQVKLFRAG